MNYLNGLYTVTVNGVPQFQPPNPAGGVPNGTQITYEFLNDIYLEALNIVAAGGDTPAANAPTQILKNLRRIFGGNVEQLEGSNTITADQLGFIEVVGEATYTQALPSPVGVLQPLIMFYNNTPVAQNVQTPVGTFDGPGGNSNATLSVAAGTMVLMRSDGANYCVQQSVPTNAVTLSEFAQKTYYSAAQSGAVAAGLNGSYEVLALTVTMPAFSKSSGFRVRARMIAKGNSTAAGNQNFTSVFGDGAYFSTGAPWLVNALNGSEAWGTSDTIETQAVYVPGQTYTFTMTVNTLAGSGAFNIAGCFMELLVEEA